jgi:hypothetical protein
MERFFIVNILRVNTGGDFQTITLEMMSLVCHLSVSTENEK